MTKQSKDTSNRIKPIKQFSEKLLIWFDKHGRHDLPWQQDKTAYRVWVSEIMLQQTQVAAVINYYQRFMQRFPTLEELAASDEEAVLSYWSGLGYYARGRNLLKAAKKVISDHAGKFPSDLEEIQALPGIGKSTAGAISSIAFKKAEPILDGNVKRVLSRLHDIEGWPGERKIEESLWSLAEQYTPKQRCDEYTQAIMDMGATLCTRSKPKCLLCPFQNDCLSLKNGTVNTRPTPKPKKTKPTKELWLLDIRNENQRLLEKRPSTGIWGGLYSLPEFSREYLFEELEESIEQTFGLTVSGIEAQQPFEHIFSHYKLIAHPVIVFADHYHTDMVAEETSRHWMTSYDIDSVGLPAPIKKYLADQSSLP